MSFQADPEVSQWRLHLGSPPPLVYELLMTDAGGARFCVESAVEQEGEIH